MIAMQPLQQRLHLTYGFGHFCKSLLWNLSALYFAFYLTEVAGIPSHAMGRVMAVSLVFNAACDLLTGHWLARFVHDAGTAARLQFKGSLTAAGAFVVFATTGLVPAGLRTGFSLGALLLFRLGYSLLDVPQNSFMAFVSTTNRERAALAGTRYIAAGLSMLLITLLVTPLVRMPNREGQAHLFFALAMTIAPLSVLGGWLLHLVFRGDRRGLAAPALRGDHAGADIFPLLMLCITLFSLLASFFSKLESYLTAYVLAAHWSAALFMPTVALGQVTGQLIWPRIADRIGLPKMLMTACGGWLLTTAVLWLAICALPAAIVPTALLYAAMSSGVLMAVWSLLAQSCAAAPERTAWRYGLFTFCSKLGQAAAMLAIGEWLARFDYRGAANASNPLVTLGMLGPAVAAILIGFVAFLIWQRQRQISIMAVG